MVQQRLVDNPRFQDSLLPREATRLGACLCRALAPLFHAHSNGAEIVNAETGGNNDIWEDMRYRLTGIFETALRLKVVTVMAECIGEFVIYPLSTSHIRESMAATLSQNSSSSDDQLPSSENGLWKHASIKLYAREASQPRDLSADALVLTMNFVSQMKEKCRTCLHSKDIILPEGRSLQPYQSNVMPRVMTRELLTLVQHWK